MANITSLDGKRIIFIGNSFVYYGQTVLAKGCGEFPTLDARKNDTGYFYQIAKANGENVSVTNWTFPDHRFAHLFSGEKCTHQKCQELGINHLSALTDKYYDYVILCEGSGLESDEMFAKNIKKIVTLFRDTNPNVKFVYLVHTSSHGYSVANIIQQNVLNNLKALERSGFIIVDWGALVKDVGCGAVNVPEGSNDYNKNTFIVAQNTRDGYHPNQLSGYITSLMTYCAITGRSAIGQSYDFCGNKSYNSSPIYRTFEEYIGKYYTVGKTNYDRVFASKNDMRGIQALIDRYLEEKQYRNYDFGTEN